jgi:PQ loop repeat
MLRWDMFLLSLTGFAAGTLAYLPQALHSFRSKSVRDLSLLMLEAFGRLAQQSGSEREKSGDGRIHFASRAGG